MSLSFTIAAGARQRSHSQVQVPRGSWPHFTVSDTKLSQSGGPVFISPRNRVTHLYPLGTGFPFRRSLRLAELRWRCLTPPPYGLARPVCPRDGSKWKRLFLQLQYCTVTHPLGRTAQKIQLPTVLFSLEQLLLRWIAFRVPLLHHSLLCHNLVTLVKYFCMNEIILCNYITSLSTDLLSNVLLKLRSITSKLSK
jgi:hypothetical protein